MCSEPCLCSEGGESCSFFYSCLYDIKLDFVHFVVSWITCFASIFLNLFFLRIYSPIFSLLSSLTKKVAILSLSTLSLLLVIMYPEYIDFHLFGISVNPLRFFSILFVHAQIALLM